MQVPRGRLVQSAEEAAAAVKELGVATAIKAQVLVGGRGLAGGIRFAERPEQAEEITSQVLNLSLKGEKPRAVLVEEKLQASKELYAGMTYDFNLKCPIAIASSHGGVDIETLAKEHPRDIARKPIDPFRSLKPYMGRAMAAEIGLQGILSIQYANVMNSLWRIFEQYDAELVETNPLAIVGDRLIALDAKLNLDDKSLFRQSTLLNNIEPVPPPRYEGVESRRSRAKEMGIPTYMEMEGNIGAIADGAGTGMLTLDLVVDSGGKIGVYCEMGGETTAELMENTMKAVLSVERTHVILINLIGGLNRMDEMAKGITNYLKKHPTKAPVVVRMSGTMEEDGRRILGTEGIQAYGNLYEAVERAVHLSR